MNLHNEEKLIEIFEHELSINQHLPNRSLFQLEPFRGYLFEEFKDAELKPCFWLYREQFYSMAEYERVLDNKNGRIYTYNGNEAIAAPTTNCLEHEIKLDKIYTEFTEKLKKGFLESKCYCPDILKTPIAKILLKIEEAMDNFKNPIFENERIDLYVEIVSDSLGLLKMDDLRNKVIEKLIEDNLNLKTICLEDGGLSYSKWQKRKFEFNHLLLKNQKTNSENTQKPKKGGAPKKVVDESLSLKDIMHEDYYPDAKAYYMGKVKDNKLKTDGQYGQLINEFIKKNWIKADFKKISWEQKTIVMNNEFNMTIKSDALRKIPKGNEFEDLKMKRIINIPL